MLDELGSTSPVFIVKVAQLLLNTIVEGLEIWVIGGAEWYPERNFSAD